MYRGTCEEDKGEQARKEKKKFENKWKIIGLHKEKSAKNKRDHEVTPEAQGYHIQQLRKFHTPIIGHHSSNKNGETLPKKKGDHLFQYVPDHSE
jgi:hypothetical protein